MQWPVLTYTGWGLEKIRGPPCSEIPVMPTARVFCCVDVYLSHMFLAALVYSNWNS